MTRWRAETRKAPEGAQGRAEGQGCGDGSGRREALGRLVREAWVAWAREQPGPKPSWLVPWEDLDEGQREVDMRIGEAVAAAQREQDRQLAIDTHATCTVADSMNPSRLFADLLGDDHD